MGDMGDDSGHISVQGALVRVCGLALAFAMIHRGWEFWPVVIAIICLVS